MEKLERLAILKEKKGPNSRAEVLEKWTKKCVEEITDSLKEAPSRYPEDVMYELDNYIGAIIMDLVDQKYYDNIAELLIELYPEKKNELIKFFKEYGEHDVYQNLA